MEFWIFLLAVWLFAEWMLRRRDRQKNDARFSNVIAILNRAESDFKELKRLTARVAELEKLAASHAAQQQPPAPAPDVVVSSPTPPTHVTISEPKIAPAEPSKETPHTTPPAHVPIPAPPVAAPPTYVPPLPTPSRPMQPHATPAHSPAASGAIPPQASAPPRLATAGAAAPLPLPPKRKAHDIEQALGTNWLNKIGIAALVIGVALFLAYKFPTLTNPEKVGLGYSVSFAILGLGVFLERKDVYRIFARALIGGGWALIFFTTYAMYFVKYTQVIQTESIDLVLLFAVAWAMVLHTLHYNSQVVTGLAFLLGFTTVAISENTVYCLTAGAILVVGLVAIVHKRSWFELEIFGLLASYVNHYVWLRTVIEPMGATKHMFPEFFLSAALLCTYWGLYRWSYIARRIQRDAQEHISTLAALLNTGCLLFLLKYQSVQPDLAFYALLALGAIELTLGQLPITRKRRTAMLILSTIGIVLLVAAIPFKYSGMGMAILWLAQAEILLFAGVLTSEALFRRFSFLAALLTVGEMLLVGAMPVVQDRLGQRDMLHAVPEYRFAVTFLFAALLFYADSEWVPRRWKDAAADEFDEICFRALSYLGALTLFIGLWLALPNLWTAIAWTGAAVVLAIIGHSASARDLSYEAHWIAIAGFFAALSINIGAGSTVSIFERLAEALTPALYATRHANAAPHGLSLPFLTIALVAALLYLCAFYSGPRDTPAARIFSAIHTWTAMILLALLALQQLSFAWIAVTWSLFGLLLMIAAGHFKRSQFAVQALLLSACATILSVSVNLYATQPFSLIPQLTLRLVTVALTAIFLYLSATWATSLETSFSSNIAGAYAWAGSFLVWILLLYEVHSLYVALAWVLFGLALFECGLYLESFNVRVQSYVLFASGLARIFLINVNASRHDLMITTLPLAAVFYYVHWRLQTTGRELLSDDARLFAAPLLSYFGTATIATVLYFGLDAGWIGTGWAALALVLVAAAWAFKHNVLLHHSLLLAGLVLFRTAFFDLAEPVQHGMAFLDSRSVHVIAASALLFAALPFAFALRRRFAAESNSNAIPEPLLAFIQRPEQIFFFVPLIQITALIARDVAEGRVTMAWGVEAVIVFLFALVVGERSFRLTGLGLLLLCVGKILVLDVWQQDKADRFTTFIILGVALLLVSFLYTRYSEAIRKYL